MRDGNDHGTNSVAQCPPDLSLRGPEGAAAISGRQLRFRRGCPVIGLGTARFPRRFAPRNDNSGGIHHFNDAVYRLLVLTRRSLTAAYRRNRCMLFQRWPVQSASAFPRLPRRFAPRNDKFESLMPPNYRPNTCSCQWRSGNALQTQSACTFLSLPCTNCKCLTPRFTRILRPAGGKNAALSGETPIFRMFCGQNGVQWAESLQKNNIAGKTDKRARNFSEQLKFLCNVV